MSKTSKVTIIGLWILLGLVGLYFGITYLKGLSVLSNSNTYHVRFSNVSSVAIASPVLINGYKVGNVQQLDFDLEQGGTTVLALSVNKRYKLPKDTNVSIRQGLLGGAEVALTLGKSAEVLQNKDTLIAQKPGPDYVEMLNNEVIPAVKRLIPKADSILSAWNSISNNPEIPATLKEMHATVGSVKHTMANIEAVSKQLKSITEEEVPVITADFRQFASNMASISGALDSAQLGSILHNLEYASAELKTLSEQLNKDSSTMGALVNDKELYMRVDSLVRSTDLLIKDIKANPKRYLKISVF